PHQGGAREPHCRLQDHFRGPQQLLQGAAAALRLRSQGGLAEGNPPFPRRAWATPSVNHLALPCEFVGSQAGLRYLLTSASGQMDTSLVFAVLVTFSAMAVLLFMLIECLERLAIPWHASMRSRTIGR